MPQEIFYNMKETLVESAPAYSTVAKWHAAFTGVQSTCDDLHQSGRLLSAQQMTGWNIKSSKFSTTEFDLARNVAPMHFSCRRLFKKWKIWCTLYISCLTDWVKVYHPTLYKIGHLGDWENKIKRLVLSKENQCTKFEVSTLAVSKIFQEV